MYEVCVVTKIHHLVGESRRATTTMCNAKLITGDSILLFGVTLFVVSFWSLTFTLALIVSKLEITQQLCRLILSGDQLL